MATIRVVGGSASGPTATASYDAALADANVHDYNLVHVSSVVPAHATVERLEEAPDLGPTGERLTVVEARATVAPGEADRAVAGIGWSRAADGPGIIYEASGTDADDVRERIDEGLAAGRRLRSWEAADGGREIERTETDADAYTTAVVLAVYGESEPLL